MTIRNDASESDSAGASDSASVRDGASGGARSSATFSATISSTGSSPPGAADSATHGASSDSAATASAPQRVWLSSRREVAPMVITLIARARRMIRIADTDLASFALEALPVCQTLERFLISHYRAQVRLLADSNTWNEQRGARLHLLQQRFSHALEIRIAALDDPVGADSYLLADDSDMLSLRPTAHAIGDLWRNNAPHAQPWAMAFERRWHAASHSLPATPLGL